MDPFAKDEARRTAILMVQGEVSVIEASRIMSSLRHHVAPEFEPLFREFVAIDSETDDLPLGSVRTHWAPAALEEKDQEIARCESLYRERAENAARAILKALSE